MNCTYCSTALPLPYSTLARIRCDRCGAVHHLDGTVISPRMIAIPDDDTPWRASPWMLSHTRPIEPGMYEVLFRDIEQPLLLTWDGARFMALGRRVQCATLVCWRGQWAK